jgi:beta-lactamase class A
MHRLLVIVAVAACGSSAPPPARPVAPPPPPAPAPVVKAVTFPGTPDTPAGKELAWVLDTIVNRGGKVERAEIERHFHPKFLTEIPADQAAQVFGQLGAQLHDLTITKAEGDAERVLAHISTAAGKLVIALQLDHASQQIAGLVFRPDAEAGPKPTSWDEAQKMVSAAAPHAQLLVAALDKGSCKSLHEVAPKDELAIGSTTKLYILLALVDRIAAGKARWEDELAVRDDWKSLPSGTTQGDPAGTKLSLKTFAERMISISDNTATDHLLYTVGRTSVEAAVRATKHAKPALNVPFLSTRELFLLKLSTPPDEVAKYIAWPEAKRRTYLDKTLAGVKPTLDGVADWKGARHIDKLEWFASANDLCRAMGTLWTRAQNPKLAPLLDVMAKNPGVPIDTKAFPYVGFKGGSEPGVINLTFLLRRADDKWFVVTLGLNSDADGTIDEAKAIGIAAGAIELLGRER